ncbi:hypothetical protein [Clostridium cylindrosporum]|uniref:Uncharacterized protein n=1 Tax=Clostridium cylindrosporum DSM 605 TaxID=1121307 RepID=A0A0J8DBZ1_CLOCY|nr:hypothetical protein [Clostridium cylindrosporum]KMT23387.1 hypothetical protein CLCY_8c01240 [Clostridium cylindrosporum DSM 605]
MSDKNLDNLIINLNDEIERKCFEIKQKRKERALKLFFMISCVMFITVPFLLTLVGINIITLSIPILLFLSLSLFILSPIILNNDLGGIVE